NPWVDSPDRKLPYTWAWSAGINHQFSANAAVSADYVTNVSRHPTGVVDFNEAVNGIRPGVDAIDPSGVLIPSEARATGFARVLEVQTSPVFNGTYKSF